MLHSKAPTLKMEASGSFTFIIGTFYQILRRHIFSAILIPLLSSKFLAVTLFAVLPCVRMCVYKYIHIAFAFLFTFSTILAVPFFPLHLLFLSLHSRLPFPRFFLAWYLVSCPLQSVYSLSSTHIKPVYYITSGDTTKLLT